MKTFRHIALTVLLAVSSVIRMDAQNYKPVTGTWLNLVWQDQRNNYMNPHFTDMMDPQLWRTKVDELHELGVDYLMITQVANEQKAFYPSDFMERAYPADKESPVEAIVDQADKNGMQVFLSCGWAKSQLDNQRDPEIKAIQIHIMEELAALFGDRKCFYGWYLPIEDSFDPYLPDESIVAANIITRKAKEIAPGKKVMISPYGLYRAKVADPQFGKQIEKLEVDIIAYQDEIGCVRKTFPMKEMKENFALLRAIHDKAGIELWANVESFAWSRNPNNWYSALIPAPFGRYLSQIVGVNQAKADRIVSFAINGIIDKPGSAYPLGMPTQAGLAYKNYKNWLEGKGRWPMLAASFADKLENGAKGASVEVVGAKAAAVQYDTEVFTDNVLGYEDATLDEWAEFEEGHMELVLDLGKKKEVHQLAVRFLHHKKSNIAIPPMVQFYTSANGKKFELVSTVLTHVSPNDLHDCWIDMALTEELSTKARYIKVVADSDPDAFGTYEIPTILCDEIFVDPVIVE